MSVNVEIEGKLIVKNDVNQVSDSFKKREFIVYVENERNVDYSDKIKIELKQDKTDLIETSNIGDVIKCQCNLTGREWEKDGKIMYFNTIECWKLEAVSKSSDVPKEDDAPPF